ncbi:hypothetical protein [Microbacterium pumilum]|uniref:Integrin beta subunit VWA domain-containing protein n=1 Tax=Microbacterium pumilum TaxID=344165 RepID=A0ABN2RQW5_9MICO
MPHEFPLGDVPQDVVKHLAEELGIAEPRLISASETRLPTGELARLVTAVDPAKPNTVVSTTVSEAGVIRPLAALERLLGGGRLFVPEFPPGHELPPVRREPVTIDPKTNDWRLNRCERVTEKITVTVPKSSAPPKADVYLLADTTGSMGSVLASVAAGASAILNNPALAGFDVAWGVGNYRDFPVDGGIHNSFAFAHQVSPTTNLAVADAAISTWVAGEGADGPEGQLFALHQIATDASIGWRADARRILVWFGDAPGHDPIPTALSGLAADITEATATADLVAAEIAVVAVSTTTGFATALDDDPNATAFDYAPSVPAGAAGQATRITAATPGGSHTTGVNPADIVTTLATLIAAAVSSIGSVSLVPTGDTAQFVESITPASYGPLPGDVEHVLVFEVTWVGVRDCREHDQVFTGTIDVVADGVVVAQKRVRVTVPACRYHYSVEFVSGQNDDRDPGPFLPGRYATAVTIYNPGTCPVEIEKRFAPLVVEGRAIGREPDVVPAKPFAAITLQAGEATFDDQVALKEFGAVVGGLFFGVLDIVSDRPLSVTATHTAGGHEAGLSITSRTIEAMRAP